MAKGLGTPPVFVERKYAEKREKYVTRRIRRMVREACELCDETNCRGCRFTKPAKEVGLKIERTKDGVKVSRL